MENIFVSFGQAFNERIKNPFLATFTFVLLLRNWRALYSVFNFEEGTTLNTKIDYLTAFYSNTSIWGELLTNAWISLLLFVVTYALINISRVVVQLSEKRLKPWVYKWTHSKSVVTIDIYDRIFENRDMLLKQIRSLKEIISTNESQIRNIEDLRIKELKLHDDMKVELQEIRLEYHTRSDALINKDAAFETLQTSYDKLNANFSRSEMQINILESKIQDLKKDLVFSELSDNNFQTEMEKEHDFVLTNLQNRTKFIQLVEFVNKGTKFANFGTNGTELISKGYFTNRKVKNSVDTIELTNKGKRILRYLNIANREK